MTQPKKDKNLVYDVGMYKAEDTEYYLKKGFKVVAFEAQPALVEECTARFAKEIDSGQLVIVYGAIVSAEEKKKNPTVKFFRNIDCGVWSTVVTDRAMMNEKWGTTNEIIEVPAVDFGECVAKYGVPHFLKIDIEGMDIVCLTALRQFDEKPDYISMESDKISFAKIEDELGLFKELGYCHFQAVNQESIKFQKEPAHTKEGSYAGYNRFQPGASGLFGAELRNRWTDFDGIVRQYRSIFFIYDMVGDHGKLRKYLLGKALAKTLKFLTQKRIPGWYDTHAKHVTA